MGKILLLLFTVVPLVELWLLLWIGDRVGFWPTVGIVLATGLIGATLAKAEGLRVVQRWQEATSRGQLPEEGVLGGLLVLVGGVFLITPGVLTDVTGLLLLFPPTRRLVAGFVRRRFERGMQNGAVQFTQVGGASVYTWGSGARRGSPGVIDVEGVDITPGKPELPPGSDD
ncbi:MAG: FxsA family protein [Sandaracinus sp.]|nr:FxsA family protein [Sandaracinus sp.]MCB9634172.1 FxsA family protein [Sandaracinus sp.]